MKKNFLMIVGTAMLISCSQVDLVDPVQTSDVTIQVKSVHKSISGEVNDTRAPFVGTLSESNPLTARVLTSKATGDYSGTNLHANGQMIFKGGTTTSSYEMPSVTEAQTKFPSATNSLHICGLYPLNSWSVTTTTAFTTFTGKEDVMSAPQVTTTEAEVVAGTIPTLTFSHLLTKLEVKLVAKTNAANGAWGKITKIEVLNAGGTALKNTATITLSSGGAAFAGTASSFSLFGMSESAGNITYTEAEFADYTLTTTATPVAYVMVAPFTSTGASDIKLRVTTEYKGAKEVDIDLTTYSGNTQGYAFGITLTFDVDAEAIQSSATVINWISGGDVEKEII